MNEKNKDVVQIHFYSSQLVFFIRSLWRRVLYDWNVGVFIWFLCVPLVGYFKMLSPLQVS